MIEVWHAYWICWTFVSIQFWCFASLPLSRTFNSEMRMLAFPSFIVSYGLSTLNDTSYFSDKTAFRLKTSEYQVVWVEVLTVVLYAHKAPGNSSGQVLSLLPSIFSKIMHIWKPFPIHLVAYSIVSNDFALCDTWPKVCIVPCSWMVVAICFIVSRIPNMYMLWILMNSKMVSVWKHGFERLDQCGKVVNCS